jgi:hypothetical protein
MASIADVFVTRPAGDRQDRRAAGKPLSGKGIRDMTATPRGQRPPQQPPTGPATGPPTGIRGWESSSSHCSKKKSQKVDPHC